MSLLPGQIIPQGVSFGRADPDGNVTISTNWWLFFYNISQNVLGVGSGLPTGGLIELESTDSDASDTDATSLRLPIAGLQVNYPELPPTANDFPAIARAILLAQDSLLPDPSPLAQPVSSVFPSGSPFTYKASFSGAVAVSGGTVSNIAISRQGTSVATGVTAGVFPLSRYDSLIVTYSSAPTMVFLPT
jgi:hypothetical protein